MLFIHCYNCQHPAWHRVEVNEVCKKMRINNENVINSECGTAGFEMKSF